MPSAPVAAAARRAADPALPPDAFRGLALSELERVMNFATHLVRGVGRTSAAEPTASARDGGWADDLVQETYLRAFRAADQFRGDAAGMRSWLFKILHNTFRHRFREARQVTFLAGDSPELEAAERQSEDRGRPLDHGIDWEEVDDRLLHAIQALPDDLRLVFLLLAGDGLKYREIAEVLDIPIGTVMSRVSRARRLLLDNLRPPPRPAAENKSAAASLVPSGHATIPKPGAPPEQAAQPGDVTAREKAPPKASGS